MKTVEQYLKVLKGKQTNKLEVYAQQKYLSKTVSKVNVQTQSSSTHHSRLILKRSVQGSPSKIRDKIPDGNLDLHKGIEVMKFSLKGRYS